MKKRKWLSLLLAVMMLVSAVPFFPVTADAADGTVEVSTWAELKKALDYTTNCSVVKVVKDIETKSLNGHTGLHQDNIIFMSMAMDKVLDLNGHTVHAYAKYYSEVAQGYLINICDKDARLTIRDSVGGGALIGEFNQEFYYEFINVSEGTLVMESGTVKMLCPSNDNQYLKCAIGVSGTAIFNGGEVLTQVTSPGGEREERYLSRRLQAIRGEAGGSVTINGGTFDRVVLHSTPTPENRGKYELVVNGGFFRQSIAQVLVGDVYASHLDHLTMQINDAYFMRTTDKLDPCRLAMELQYDLMLETNGVKKQVTTGYKGAKVARWVDRTKAIDTIYLDISQPLVQGDYTSGAFTVDGSAPYTIEDRQGYWEHEDIWDLTGNGSVPAILGDQYYRFIRVYLKDGYEGYKFDKNNPPKVKIRGLNRECDSISVSVASDERSLGVSLASHPSELIQNAWGTVTGLRAGSVVDGVNIRPKDSHFDFEIKEIQRIKNGVVYSTSPNEVIDPDYTYRIKLVGTGKEGMTFHNGPWRYDYTFHYYLNTNVKLRMYSDLNIAENYLEVPYDASAQAYVIDLVPEPDVINYDYLSLGVPLPWAGERPIYNNNLVAGLPGGVSVVNYTWYASATGERIQADMTFIAGRRYHVNVILQCEEGYYIADDEELDAYVNGAKAYISAQDGNRTTLTVGYSVPVASGVHGQVVSFCDGSDVTVSLFADGSAESKYTVSVPGGTKDSSGQYTTTYDIPEVAPGTYTMRVSKKNHVTREYTVTVSGDAVTQDAKIHLMGDINGDGRISISTCGYGITAFTDAGIEYIGKQIKGELSDGNFAGAFDKFADLCDDFITQARTGEPYDVKNLPKEPLSLIWIPIAIVVGFVLSLIIVGRMKAKLKTVRFQAAASNYIKDNSLNINERRDLFLYNTVTRTAKPKNDDSGGGSSTHTSSSGTTHGGGGGKF